MKLLLILTEGKSGGHHPLYGLAVARAAAHLGWRVNLAAPTASLKHEAGSELMEIAGKSCGSIIDLLVAETSRSGTLGVVARQFLVRDGIRRSVNSVSGESDAAYIVGGDAWLYASAIMGVPVTETRFVTDVLRATFHHGKASGLRGDTVRRHRLQQLAFERLLRDERCAAIVTPDPLLAQYYREQRQNHGEKIHWVPDMGYTPTPVDRSQARLAFGIPTDRKIIVCAGGLTGRKGIANLVTAIADPRCRTGIGALLLGVADGSTRALLQSRAVVALKEAGRLWVEDGVYSKERLDCALGGADAAWLGYSGHLTSSGALWEAAQAGLPVLACDAGLIGFETRRINLGLTVPPADSTAVCSALEKLMYDEAQRCIWARNGRRAGGLHTMSNFGREVVNCIGAVSGGVWGRAVSAGLKAP